MYAYALLAKKKEEKKPERMMMTDDIKDSSQSRWALRFARD